MFAFLASGESSRSDVQQYHFAKVRRAISGDPGCPCRYSGREDLPVGLVVIAYQAGWS
jgi:hypothetical protein